MESLIENFAKIHPVSQALIATLFTRSVTALGASFVFFFKKINQNVLDTMLGFAEGVIIAASFWSLLAPAIELSEQVNDFPKWFTALIHGRGTIPWNN